MKKVMVFLYGLLMGAFLTTMQMNTVDVEALVDSALASKLEAIEVISFDADSNEIVISLSETTEAEVDETIIATDLTEETMETLSEELTVLTNHTKSLYHTNVNEALKNAYLTKEDSEAVEDELSLDEVPSTISENIVSNNSVSENIEFDEVVMDKPTVEQVDFEQPVSEETTEEKVILPGGGFDSLEEIKESLDKTEEEIVSQAVQPLLATNPTHVHYTNDLKIWIEKVETGSQCYFWVEIDNNPVVSPIKRALANGLETVPTMAVRQNAILAINASGYYSSNGEVMGTTLANGSYYENTWTNASPMVIGQDNRSAWTANRLFVTDIIAQGGATTVTFGPTLVEGGHSLSINASGIGSPTGRHPRTVVGRTNAGRWFFLIVDGRTSGAAGMTLYEVQDLLSSKGISYAYNLDGGGSTTLYFDGKVLNQPTDGSPRRVPDMLYFN